MICGFHDLVYIFILMINQDLGVIFPLRLAWSLLEHIQRRTGLHLEEWVVEEEVGSALHPAHVWSLTLQNRKLLSPAPGTVSISLLHSWSSHLHSSWAPAQMKSLIVVSEGSWSILCPGGWFEKVGNMIGLLVKIGCEDRMVTVKLCLVEPQGIWRGSSLKSGKQRWVGMCRGSGDHWRAAQSDLGL